MLIRLLRHTDLSFSQHYIYFNSTRLESQKGNEPSTFSSQTGLHMSRYLFSVMAKRVFYLGDVSTADIQLRLISSNGEEYGGNPLHLHSQLLKKSKVLEALLSDRRSWNDLPLKIEVTTTVEGFEDYVKCFELFYSFASEEIFSFSSVDECLAILQVCAQFLIEECLNECMKYLGPVRWSPLQESKIRDVLTSLQLQTLPDLAARLDNRRLTYLETLEASTAAMLLFNCKSGEDKSVAANTEDGIRKYLESKLNGNVSADISHTYMRALFGEYKNNFEIMKRTDFVSIMNKEPVHACSVVVWLLKLIERTDRNMYEKASKTFCEEVNLPGAMRNLSSQTEYVKVFLKILVSFLKDLGSGKIISSRAYRRSYLTSWLNVMITICVSNSTNCGVKLEDMEKGVIELVETLPFEDQKSAYKDWIAEYKRNRIDISRLFRWWFEKVEHAVDNSKPEG